MPKFIEIADLTEEEIYNSKIGLCDSSGNETRTTYSNKLGCSVDFFWSAENPRIFEFKMQSLESLYHEEDHSPSYYARLHFKNKQSQQNKCFTNFENNNGDQQ